MTVFLEFASGYYGTWLPKISAFAGEQLIGLWLWEHSVLNKLEYVAFCYSLPFHLTLASSVFICNIREAAGKWGTACSFKILSLPCYINVFVGTGFMLTSRSPPSPIRIPGVIFIRITGFKKKKSSLSLRITLCLKQHVSLPKSNSFYEN